MVMDQKALQGHWDKILADEGLEVIETKNRILLPEKIVLPRARIARLLLAEEWLADFSPRKLEKIRTGPSIGKPNRMHKRAIELYVKYKSTRKVAEALNKEGHKIRFQGVAKILKRYLGE